MEKIILEETMKIHCLAYLCSVSLGLVSCTSLPTWAQESFIQREIKHYSALAEKQEVEGVGSILANTKYLASLPVAKRVDSSIQTILSESSRSIVLFGINENTSQYTCDVFYQPKTDHRVWAHKSIAIDIDNDKVSVSPERTLPTYALGHIPQIMPTTTGIYSPVRGHDLTWLQATYTVAKKAETYRCAAYGIPNLAKMTIPGRIGTLAWTLLGIVHTDKKSEKQ